MATWEVKLTVLNLTEKIVSIKATRTDGEDVVEYNIHDTPIATPEQKQNAINMIWTKHQDRLSRQAKIAGVISGLETSAKNALEAKEQT